MKNLDQTHPDPKIEIVNSYLTPINSSFSENRPQMKLVNFGTGSGKTYAFFQAVYETIQKHDPSVQIVGLYVAPLREHLQVPEDLRRQYAHIPVHIIYSIEMKMSDEHLGLYEKWLPDILANQKLWDDLTKVASAQKVEDGRRQLRRALGSARDLRAMKAMKGGEETLGQTLIKRTRQDINYAIEQFLEFLVKSRPEESTWPAPCLRLLEIFFPLHVLRKKSGILLMTCMKFQTRLPYFMFNGETWVKDEQRIYDYVADHTVEGRKFILAFDEQEDGYDLLLCSLIDMISPQKLGINNALSSLYRELAPLFSDDHRENVRFLKFARNKPRALREFEEHLDKGKTLAPALLEHLGAYQRLTRTEANSVNFLRNLGAIHDGLEKALQQIAQVFEAHDEVEPFEFNLDLFRRVLAPFENNRSLLIKRTLYSQIGSELMNLFAYNNIYVYNIEPLKKLSLQNLANGLVCIKELEHPDEVSVAELIYAILAIRLQIKEIKKHLNNVLTAEDSQSRSLEIWATQVTKAQKKSARQVEKQTSKPRYMNRFYVYESAKSIINIEEMSRYQHPTNNLIGPDFREVSIGSIAILTSPEHILRSMVSRGSNVLFLVSATGGITSDLSTSYDMHYLAEGLRDASGRTSFQAMSDEEIALSERIRQYREGLRRIEVEFFSATPAIYPNRKTRSVAETFKEGPLGRFVESLKGRGKEKTDDLSFYKKQELEKFVHFLFYLFEAEPVQAMFVFTQSLKWIRQLLHFSTMRKHAQYLIEPSEEHPDIYYAAVRHPDYESKHRIKIILFTTAFNSRYTRNLDGRTYQDELVEEEGQKLFFISAYPSASKGLNPIVRTREGKEKDFDALVLLMDSFYSTMKPSTRKPGSSIPETQYHFALMKKVVGLGETYLEIEQFNRYLSDPEASQFREEQHHVLLGKSVLQAIGRTERRDYEGQTMQIFINEETQQNLETFYRFLEQKEPGEIRKLSVNNHAVYRRVQEEAAKQAIQDYAVHEEAEASATWEIHEFRETMLDKIEHLHVRRGTSEIVTAWELLRDPLVFKSPERYLSKLRDSHLFPDEFLDALFYQPPAIANFRPYLAKLKEEGKTFQIISDRVHGAKPYSYQERLYPDYLKVSARDLDSQGPDVLPLDLSTNLIYRLYRSLLPTPRVFDRYIPRPHFFYDVLYPALAEHFVRNWIEEVIFGGQSWKSIKRDYNGFEPVENFNKYNKLFERFDLYYRRGEVLFCIDVKAWSKPSGKRLSQKTVDKARRKLDSMVKEYDEFREARGLLVNLYSPEEKTQTLFPNLFSGSLIYLDPYGFPVASRILERFLLGKEI